MLTATPPLTSGPATPRRRAQRQNMNEPTTRARRLAAPVTRTTALFLGAAMLLTGCAVAQQNATAEPAS